MRIRFDEEIGIIELDGVRISANVLREIVNPDRRVLFRFVREGEVIRTVVYSEADVVWFDKTEDMTDQTIELGFRNQDGNEESD